MHTRVDVNLSQWEFVDIPSLQKLQLGTFRGDPIDYQVFISLFMTCVDDTQASSSVKLNRLLKLCQGKPLDLVKCCMSPDLGHSKAKYRNVLRFYFWKSIALMIVF